MIFKDFLDSLKIDNCLRIGKINKTHGTNGQLNAHFFVDFNRLDNKNVLILIDGLLIPYKIESFNYSNNFSKSIFKFESIDNVDFAQKFVNKDIFYFNNYISDLDVIINIEELIVGFCLYSDNNYIGEIVEFIDDENNPLFVLHNKNKKMVLPTNSVEINNIEVRNKEIYTTLRSEPYSI